jgi:cell division protein FtsB
MIDFQTKRANSHGEILAQENEKSKLEIDKLERGDMVEYYEGYWKMG